MTESVNTELRIAVIGAGPAGVYSSDIFLRQLKKLGEELGLGTEARIDLFEKLPVPFGLVRYGVAPDHPSIKFIASALEKTLDNPNIHLYCDVEFGKDVTLDDLLARYDAVLFATGAVKDKPLNLPHKHKLNLLARRSQHLMILSLTLTGILLTTLVSIGKMMIFW